MIIEMVAATTVAVSLRNPFGEPERTAGGPLRHLRLGTALATTATAIALLALAALPQQLPGARH
ncbi:hypothetical protein KV557_18020 [Kitasatospora aureofaciens]|uniref:hypothetical protein n=1 Tax=Kitasatospora aureofaciens TaxID=1894 RepID=UPI001C48E573|nr:hypothetical protein [Kitasatospora aureofaciens]MBV6698989.1 hypothetical protein [Kitasatospora aureofaciens]